MGTKYIQVASSTLYLIQSGNNCVHFLVARIFEGVFEELYKQ